MNKALSVALKRAEDVDHFIHMVDRTFSTRCGACLAVMDWNKLIELGRYMESLNPKEEMDSTCNAKAILESKAILKDHFFKGYRYPMKVIEHKR